MNTTDEIYFKLGLKLVLDKADVKVYSAEYDGFKIEANYFMNGSIRIFITANFDDTSIKVMREFRDSYPVGYNPKVEISGLIDKIILILNDFSNILVSKSNQFNGEVKRLELVKMRTLYE